MNVIIIDTLTPETILEFSTVSPFLQPSCSNKRMLQDHGHAKVKS